MKPRHHLIALAGLLSGAASAAPTSSQIVTSADGVGVHVYDYRPVRDRGAFPIMMFHQAESDARGELGPIADRLSGEGFRVFTADLRSGGRKLGGINATAAGFKGAAEMCGAYPDMISAISAARKATGKPVILVGSSYTAALVVKAAAERPDDVAGFVSLSPASGAPIADCQPEPWLARVRDPGMAVRPRREIEGAAWIREQAETWRAAGIPVQVFDIPAHGASMLVPERGGENARQALKALRKFMGALQRDEGVDLASGEWRLRGDFRAGLREGRRPAVLLLNKTAGDRKAYERLAAELARRGISSLRIDLRGHGDSTNAGRFEPGPNAMSLVGSSDIDVSAALAWLKARPDVDSDRIGIVGAGYSGEAAVAAARRDGAFARAYALLSPGSLSALSVKDLDGSGARWMLVHAAREQFLKSVVETVQRDSDRAVIKELDSARHASDLLDEPLGLAPSLAAWFDDALREDAAAPGRVPG